MRPRGPIRRDGRRRRHPIFPEARARAQRSVHRQEIIRDPRLHVAANDIAIATPTGIWIHPRLDREVLQRESRLVGRIQVIGGAAAEHQRLQLQRHQRVRRTRSGNLFRKVVQPIVIGIGQAGIAAVNLLVQILQPITVVVLVSIQDAVPIAVRLQRMRVAPVLIQIAQSVAVGIAPLLDILVAEKEALPPFRHSGLDVTREGGIHVGIGGEDHVAQGEIPVQRMLNIFRRHAPVIEHIPHLVQLAQDASERFLQACFARRLIVGAAGQRRNALQFVGVLKQEPDRIHRDLLVAHAQDVLRRRRFLLGERFTVRQEERQMALIG